MSVSKPISRRIGDCLLRQSRLPAQTWQARKIGAQMMNMESAGGVGVLAGLTSVGGCQHQNSA
jgi:hypothetical protein